MLAIAPVEYPVNVPEAEAILPPEASPAAPLARLSKAAATSAAVAPDPPAVIVIPARLKV